MQMDEAKLRLTVLKPLFEKMGFRDVFHYHGGSEEKGKDFVMWKPGELEERINYAVVVKAGRITGKANMASSSSGCVTFQIQQALGSTFVDEVTGAEQTVHICWVLASQEISKEAELAITSALKVSAFERNVRFVNGDRLWDLVKFHFPESEALDNLKRATEIFENLDKDWRIAVSNTGGKNTFALEPKHNKAQAKLRLNLLFREDPSSRKKAQEFKDWYEKGTPVTLDASHIAAIDLPPFLRDFIGPVGQISLQPRDLGKATLINLSVENCDGTIIQGGCFELKAERAGSRETLFSNRHQNHPFTFEVLVEHQTRIGRTQFEYDCRKGNVFQVFQAAKLIDSLSRPGLLILEIAATGISFARLRTESAEPRPNPIEPQILQFLNNLVTIQRLTRKELRFTEHTITSSLMRSVAGTAALLVTGRYAENGLKVEIGLSRQAAANALHESREGVQSWRIVDPNHKEEILGQEIPIGPVLIHIKNGRINPHSFADLRERLRVAESTEFLGIFEPVDESEVELFSLNMLTVCSDVPAWVCEWIQQYPQDLALWSASATAITATQR